MTRGRPRITRGRLYDTAQEFMDHLEAREDVAVQDLLRSWSDAYWIARRDLDALVAMVDAVRAEGGDVPVSWLLRQARFRQVLRTVRQQVAMYAADVNTATEDAQRAAAAMGVDNARELAQAAAIASQGPQVAATVAGLAPDALAPLVGFLADGSPLVVHLTNTLATDAADRLRDVLTRGLVAGWDQRRMVRAFTDGLAVTHARATTIVRTESLRLYREASRQVYMTNADVVAGWEWLCALDRRSCVACIAMHGTVHARDEVLDGHPRCRCAMVPTTSPAPYLRPGEEWLAAQPATVQRAIMGPGKYDAWTSGEVSLADMVARRDDPDWGTMRAERSMKSIREGRNANWNRRPGDDTPDAPDAPTRPAEPDWDAWEDGRDVHVRKSGPRDLEWAEAAVARARTMHEQDLAQVADFRALIKQRQAELRHYVPDAKERAKAARTDYTLKERKASLARVEAMAEQSADMLRRAEADLAPLVNNLPDFDPANPLKFYGDRVVLYDRSDSTAKHLRELADDMSPAAHHLLRDHYASSSTGGFYIGDRYITDLDDLGHLKGVQPRGWAEGSTFDEVPGVYSPDTRVCACGGDGKGHGSTSLILHEGGHALDDAHGTLGVRGETIRASERADYHDAVAAVSEYARSGWRPYYRPDGNPTGHHSEAWAEGFAGWTKARHLPEIEQARAVAVALSGRHAPPPDEVVRAHLPLVAYYRSLQ